APAVPLRPAEAAAPSLPAARSAADRCAPNTRPTSICSQAWRARGWRYSNWVRDLGDGGRASLEVGAAPVPLPIAVAGRLRPGRAADLARRRGARAGIFRRLLRFSGVGLGIGLGHIEDMTPPGACAKA